MARWQFPYPGAWKGYSTGFVVEFEPDQGDPWIANLESGTTKLCGVRSHPDGQRVLVIARGMAHAVDPSSRCAESFGGDFEYVIPVEDLNTVILAGWCEIEAHGVAGRCWTTRRLAFDGLHDLRVEGNLLLGKASACGDESSPFTIDLLTGEVTGGGYPG